VQPKHCNLLTETAYVRWIRRFIFFHDRRHPWEMGKPRLDGVTRAKKSSCLPIGLMREEVPAVIGRSMAPEILLTLRQLSGGGAARVQHGGIRGLRQAPGSLDSRPAFKRGRALGPTSGLRQKKGLPDERQEGRKLNGGSGTKTGGGPPIREEVLSSVARMQPGRVAAKSGISTDRHETPDSGPPLFKPGAGSAARATAFGPLSPAKWGRGLGRG